MYNIDITPNASLPKIVKHTRRQKEQQIERYH